MNFEEKRASCCICSKSSSFSFAKDGFDIFECLNCGLFFVHPQPQKDFLKKEVYAGSYQSNKKVDLTKVKLSEDKLKIIKYIRNTIPTGSKILDIGCSNGEFIFNLKQAGYDCYGVELNSHTYNIAKNNGLNVFNGTIEDAGFVDDYFDLIFLGDVIEHTSNPLIFFNDCVRVLKKKGLIVVSTPNMDCFWAKSTLFLMKWLGIPWSLATPPHHLFQFSFGNLNLLSKKSNLNLTDNWFNYPPALKYEIGQTHIWGNFKREKSLKNLFKLISGVIFYPLFYFINKITKFIHKKDCGMVCVYRK